MHAPSPHTHRPAHTRLNRGRGLPARGRRDLCRHRDGRHGGPLSPPVPSTYQRLKLASSLAPRSRGPARIKQRFPCTVQGMRTRALCARCRCSAALSLWQDRTRPRRRLGRALLVVLAGPHPAIGHRCIFPEPVEPVVAAVEEPVLGAVEPRLQVGVLSDTLQTTLRVVVHTRVGHYAADACHGAAEVVKGLNVLRARVRTRERDCARAHREAAAMGQPPERWERAGESWIAAADGLGRALCRRPAGRTCPRRESVFAFVTSARVSACARATSRPCVSRSAAERASSEPPSAKVRASSPVSPQRTPTDPSRAAILHVHAACASACRTERERERESAGARAHRWGRGRAHVARAGAGGPHLAPSLHDLHVAAAASRSCHGMCRMTSGITSTGSARHSRARCSARRRSFRRASCAARCRCCSRWRRRSRSASAAAFRARSARAASARRCASDACALTGRSGDRGRALSSCSAAASAAPYACVGAPADEAHVLAAPAAPPPAPARRLASAEPLRASAARIFASCAARRAAASPPPPSILPPAGAPPHLGTRPHTHRVTHTHTQGTHTVTQGTHTHTQGTHTHSHTHTHRVHTHTRTRTRTRTHTHTPPPTPTPSPPPRAPGVAPAARSNARARRSFALRASLRTLNSKNLIPAFPPQNLNSAVQ